MATIPFFRGADRNDLIFCATVCKALFENDAEAYTAAFRSLGAGRVHFWPRSGAGQDALTYVSDTYTIVVVQGSDGLEQFIGQFLLSGQSPTTGFPGDTNFYQTTTALGVKRAINAEVAPTQTTTQWVFIGHSLGGAVAQLLSTYYGPDLTKPFSCFMLGAPRVGNPTYATAAASYTIRLTTDRDPIPSVPPTTWAGPLSAFPIPGPPPSQTYQAAGAPWTIGDNGDLFFGEQLLTQDQVAAIVQTGSAPSHYLSYYLSKLYMDGNLDHLKPGDDGFVSPADLLVSVQRNLGLAPYASPPNLGDNVMASQLVQGLMFFSDRNRAEGWSEAIFGVTDVPTMVTLLATLSPLRAAFMSKNIQIIAYRASNVGAPKSSAIRKLSSPVPGALSDDVNEAGDCVIYNYKSSATGHRRSMTFRGMPDGSIQADNLTAIGIALLPVIDTYVQAVKDAGIGIKIPDATVLQQPIESMANIVPGGLIQVTSTLAHGLATGDVVKIAGLRNYPYLLGNWKVNVTSATAFLLNGSARYNISSGATGTFQGIQYVLQTADNFGYNQVGYRQTGRPFGLSRGRSPRRVIHS